MRTKKEIQEMIDRLEKQKKSAYCSYQYDLYSNIDIEISTLKWVLTENKSVTDLKRNS